MNKKVILPLVIIFCITVPLVVASQDWINQNGLQGNPFSVVWNAILIYGGYFLGKNWHLVITILKRYNQAIVALLVLSLLFYLWKKNKKKKEGAQ